MDKPKRLIIYGLYFMLCLTAEVFILWLFPYTGLGGLICWPLTIIFSLGLGYIIYRIAKRQFKFWQFSILFFCIFVFQVTLQLWTTPQDFGGDTFSKISDTYKAYLNYYNIEYADFPNQTTAERVVFIYKFKNELPNSFVTLQIDSTGQDYKSINSRVYIIENRNGIRYYDTTKLKLIETDTATVIIEYYKNNDTLIHKMNRNFLNIKAGGWGDKKLNLNVNEDDFKIETGIEKLLYSILGQTKKPNR
jgi:hypothetical protein